MKTRFGYNPLHQMPYFDQRKIPTSNQVKRLDLHGVNFTAVERMTRDEARILLRQKDSEALKENRKLARMK